MENGSKISKSLPLFLLGYEKIKNLIIDGHLESGQRVTDNQLSEMLGISRTPVREAVRMLCHENLLKSEDGIVTVYEPSLRDLGEIYSLRAMLEGLAISILVSNENQYELADHLEKVIASSVEAYEKKDFARVATCNRHFHNMFFTCSNSDMIFEQMKNIDVKMHIYRRLSLQKTDHILTSISEHLAIVESLKRGDLVTCRLQVERHILEAGHQLYSEMAKSGNLSDHNSKHILNYFEKMKSVRYGLTQGGTAQNAVPNIKEGKQL